MKNGRNIVKLPSPHVSLDFPSHSLCVPLPLSPHVPHPLTLACPNVQSSFERKSIPHSPSPSPIFLTLSVCLYISLYYSKERLCLDSLCEEVACYGDLNTASSTPIAKVALSLSDYLAVYPQFFFFVFSISFFLWASIACDHQACLLFPSHWLSVLLFSRPQ